MHSSEGCQVKGNAELAGSSTEPASSVPPPLYTLFLTPAERKQHSQSTKIEVKAVKSAPTVMAKSLKHKGIRARVQNDESEVAVGKPEAATALHLSGAALGSGESARLMRGGTEVNATLQQTGKAKNLKQKSIRSEGPRQATGTVASNVEDPTAVQERTAVEAVEGASLMWESKDIAAAAPYTIIANVPFGKYPGSTGKLISESFEGPQGMPAIKQVNVSPCVVNVTQNPKSASDQKSRQVRKGDGGGKARRRKTEDKDETAELHGKVKRRKDDKGEKSTLQGKVRVPKKEKEGNEKASGVQRKLQLGKVTAASEAHELHVPSMTATPPLNEAAVKLAELCELPLELGQERIEAHVKKIQPPPIATKTLPEKLETKFQLKISGNDVELSLHPRTSNDKTESVSQAKEADLKIETDCHPKTPEIELCTKVSIEESTIGVHPGTSEHNLGITHTPGILADDFQIELHSDNAVPEHNDGALIINEIKSSHREEHEEVQLPLEVKQVEETPATKGMALVSPAAAETALEQQKATPLPNEEDVIGSHRADQSAARTMTSNLTPRTPELTMPSVNDEPLLGPSVASSDIQPKTVVAAAPAANVCALFLPPAERRRLQREAAEAVRSRTSTEEAADANVAGEAAAGAVAPAAEEPTGLEIVQGAGTATACMDDALADGKTRSGRGRKGRRVSGKGLVPSDPPPLSATLPQPATMEATFVTCPIPAMGEIKVDLQLDMGDQQFREQEQICGGMRKDIAVVPGQKQDHGELAECERPDLVSVPSAVEETLVNNQVLPSLLEGQNPPLAPVCALFLPLAERRRLQRETDEARRLVTSAAEAVTAPEVVAGAAAGAGATSVCMDETLTEVKSRKVRVSGVGKNSGKRKGPSPQLPHSTALLKPADTEARLEGMPGGETMKPQANTTDALRGGEGQCTGMDIGKDVLYQGEVKGDLGSDEVERHTQNTLLSLPHTEGEEVLLEGNPRVRDSLEAEDPRARSGAKRSCTLRTCSVLTPPVNITTSPRQKRQRRRMTTDQAPLQSPIISPAQLELGLRLNEEAVAGDLIQRVNIIDSQNRDEDCPTANQAQQQSLEIPRGDKVQQVSGEGMVHKVGATGSQKRGRRRLSANKCQQQSSAISPVQLDLVPTQTMPNQLAAEIDVIDLGSSPSEAAKRAGCQVDMFPGAGVEETGPNGNRQSPGPRRSSRRRSSTVMLDISSESRGKSDLDSSVSPVLRKRSARKTQGLHPLPSTAAAPMQAPPPPPAPAAPVCALFLPAAERKKKLRETREASRAAQHADVEPQSDPDKADKAQLSRKRSAARRSSAVSIGAGKEMETDNAKESVQVVVVDNDEALLKKQGEAIPSLRMNGAETICVGSTVTAAGPPLPINPFFLARKAPAPRMTVQQPNELPTGAEIMPLKISDGSVGGLLPCLAPVHVNWLAPKGNSFGVSPHSAAVLCLASHHATKDGLSISNNAENSVGCKVMGHNVGTTGGSSVLTDLTNVGRDLPASLTGLSAEGMDAFRCDRPHDEQNAPNQHPCHLSINENRDLHVSSTCLSAGAMDASERDHPQGMFNGTELHPFQSSRSAHSSGEGPFSPALHSALVFKCLEMDSQRPAALAFTEYRPPPFLQQSKSCSFLPASTDSAAARLLSQPAPSPEVLDLCDPTSPECITANTTPRCVAKADSSLLNRSESSQALLHQGASPGHVPGSTSLQSPRQVESEQCGRGDAVNTSNNDLIAQGGVEGASVHVPLLAELAAYLTQCARESSGGESQSHELLDLPSEAELLSQLQVEAEQLAAQGAAAEAARAGHPGTDGAQGLLWTMKYQPNSSAQVCGNEAAVSQLRTWLEGWRDSIRAETQQGKTGNLTSPSRAPLRSSGTRARRAADSGSSDFDSDCSSARGSDDGGCRGALLVSGPLGCGKTCAVYACAEELGFQVIEVNASSSRGGGQLMRLVGEATQSRRLARQGEGGEGTRAPVNGNKNKEVEEEEELEVGARRRRQRGKRAAIVDDELSSPETSVRLKRAAKCGRGGSGARMRRTAVAAHTPSAPASPVGLPERPGASGPLPSLLLFDDADVLCGEDRGFLSALAALALESKRPLVICLDSPEVPAPLAALDLPHVMLGPPPHADALRRLALICAAANATPSLSDLQELLRDCGADLRHAIITAKLWWGSPSSSTQKSSLQSNAGSGTLLGKSADRPSLDAAASLLRDICMNAACPSPAAPVATVLEQRQQLLLHQHKHALKLRTAALAERVPELLEASRGMKRSARRKASIASSEAAATGAEVLGPASDSAPTLVSACRSPSCHAERTAGCGAKIALSPSRSALSPVAELFVPGDGGVLEESPPENIVSLVAGLCTSGNDAVAVTAFKSALSPVADVCAAVDGDVLAASPSRSIPSPFAVPHTSGNGDAVAASPSRNIMSQAAGLCTPGDGDVMAASASRSSVPPIGAQCTSEHEDRVRASASMNVVSPVAELCTSADRNEDRVSASPCKIVVSPAVEEAAGTVQRVQCDERQTSGSREAEQNPCLNALDSGVQGPRQIPCDDRLDNSFLGEEQAQCGNGIDSGSQRPEQMPCDDGDHSQPAMQAKPEAAGQSDQRDSADVLGIGIPVAEQMQCDDGPSTTVQRQGQMQRGDGDDTQPALPAKAASLSALQDSADVPGTGCPVAEHMQCDDGPSSSAQRPEQLQCNEACPSQPAMQVEAQAACQSDLQDPEEGPALPPLPVPCCAVEELARDAGCCRMAWLSSLLDTLSSCDLLGSPHCLLPPVTGPAPSCQGQGSHLHDFIHLGNNSACISLSDGHHKQEPRLLHKFALHGVDGESPAAAQQELEMWESFGLGSAEPRSQLTAESSISQDTVPEVVTLLKQLAAPLLSSPTLVPRPMHVASSRQLAWTATPVSMNVRMAKANSVVVNLGRNGTLQTRAAGLDFLGWAASVCTLETNRNALLQAAGGRGRRAMRFHHYLLEACPELEEAGIKFLDECYRR